MGIGLVFLLAALVGTALTGTAEAQSIAPQVVRQRDLLADAGLDQFWIARVTRDTQDNTFETSIVYRTKFAGNADWTELPPIPDRVVSMANSEGELLIVLANGQWEIADDTDIRSGPSGETWDTMLAVAAEQNVVWAVVRNSGSITTQESPTTGATEAEASTGAATQPQADTRLMISEFADGRWTKPRPLPEGVSDDPSEMSLAVVNELPVLAWRRGDGRLAISELSAAHGWNKPVLVAAPAGPIDFKLLTVNENDRAVLWMASAPPTTQATTQASVRTAGTVLIGNDFTRRIALTMPKPVAGGINSQTLVAAFGNLRWIAYSGDQQIEQDYSLDAFPKSFSPVKMSMTAGPTPMVIQLAPWLGGDAVLVLLAGLAGVRQRNMTAQEVVSGEAAGASGGEASGKPDAKPRLAPLGVRFVAGLVDLAPILAVFVILRPASSPNLLASIDRESLKQLLWISVAAYVLHTLAAEMICGQSIGKIVFNLRVMGADGKPAKPLAILVRNLLRVLDVMLALPLLIVLVTPLQQRVGDMLAGTVVIALNEDDEDHPEA
jgi:uncharacterized RDD family membrane protein YckC